MAKEKAKPKANKVEKIDIDLSIAERSIQKTVVELRFNYIAYRQKAKDKKVKGEDKTKILAAMRKVQNSIKTLSLELKP